jgi:hypothetical protein
VKLSLFCGHISLSFQGSVKTASRARSLDPPTQGTNDDAVTGADTRWSGLIAGDWSDIIITACLMFAYAMPMSASAYRRPDPLDYSEESS